MTTSAEYLTDLRAVLNGQGVERSYLLRWWAVRESMVDKPALFVLVELIRRKPQRSVVRFDLALYRADAPPRTPPLVLVPVGAEEPVPQLRQRQPVIARGTVDAGRAVVVRADEHEFRPIGPATRPVFLLRRYRL